VSQQEDEYQHEDGCAPVKAATWAANPDNMLVTVYELKVFGLGGDC
jgi:hypothetical protein